MKRRLYLISFVLLFGALSASAQLLYVKPTGSDFSNGLSWATAFQSIQKALNVAPFGTKILVAFGTYYPDEGFGAVDNLLTSSFILKNGVEIYGGFEPDFGIDDLGDTRVKRSRLSGDLMQDDFLGASNIFDNANHVLMAQSVSNAVLDGFIISDGYANGVGDQSNGGGILIMGSSLNIKNCSFTTNRAINGGAIYSGASSAPVLLNCSFSINDASNSGGAIANNLSTGTITNCSFLSNYSSSWGGAIFNSIASPALTNCIFLNNRAGYGAGIYNNSSSPTIINCSFSGNVATITGGGINNFYHSSPDITNCIIWSNSAPTGSQIANGDPNSDVPAVTYSIVQGGYAGTGNSAQDPLFVDASKNNFNLQPCSPAIDAGNNAVIPAAVNTDINENTRIVHVTVDMGALEYNGTLYTYYRDADQDGFGDANNSIESFCPNPPNGYVTNSDDCNDDHLGPCVTCQTEAWLDADGDGYGDPAHMLTICNFLPGYVDNNSDCNDADNTIHPGATEICGNGKDDNCNGLVDEDCAVCGNATSFSTTNITSTTATLNWVAPVDPEQWQVQYKSTAPGSKWADVANVLPSDRSKTLTGLKPNQTYMWHIRAKCDHVWSAYSNSIPFKTLSANGSIITYSNVESEVNANIGLTVRVISNPGISGFTLQIRSSNNDAVKLRIMDATGRIVETKSAIAPNTTLSVGQSYSSGIYFAQLVQGGEQVVLKLAKQ